MDLLGSILGAMDKPPSRDKKEKEMIEKQKKELETMRNKERDELNRFRKYAEERLGRLIKDPVRTFMEFQPLDKVHRSVVHDIAEIAGLVAMSFGVEGVDRYIVVYKKENMPSENELAVRRSGEPWNKQTAEEYCEKKKQQQMLEKERQKRPLNEKATEPASNYKDKYVHLIGQDAALEAAKKTESNKTYGYVPSENKRDVRSIEQTMADIQAKKKKLKTQHVSDEPTEAPVADSSGSGGQT